MNCDYHKEAIGLAKLRFALAIAAFSGIVTWVVQDRPTGWYLVLGVATAGVAALFAAVLFWQAEHHLMATKGDSDAGE